MHTALQCGGLLVAERDPTIVPSLHQPPDSSCLFTNSPILLYKALRVRFSSNKLRMWSSAMAVSNVEIFLFQIRGWQRKRPGESSANTVGQWQHLSGLRFWSDDMREEEMWWPDMCMFGPKWLVMWKQWLDMKRLRVWWTRSDKEPNHHHGEAGQEEGEGLAERINFSHHRSPYPGRCGRKLQVPTLERHFPWYHEFGRIHCYQPISSFLPLWFCYCTFSCHHSWLQCLHLLG